MTWKFSVTCDTERVDIIIVIVEKNVYGERKSFISYISVYFIYIYSAQKKLESCN